MHNKDKATTIIFNLAQTSTMSHSKNNTDYFCVCVTLFFYHETTESKNVKCGGLD